MDKSSSNSVSTLATIRDLSSTCELYATEKSDRKEKSNNDEKGKESTRLATTDLEALLHVIKASLGSGLLAMPVAFKNAGLLEGLIGTIFVGIICTHGTHLLVKASQRMCSDIKRPSLGYAETVEIVFKTTPHVRLNSYASLGKSIVNIFLFLTYFGTNLIYTVLVASTLQEVIRNHYALDWNVRWYMIICLIPLLIVGTIRSMKYLVPFSVLANVFLFIGLIMTFYYVLQDIPPISSRPLFVSFTKFPLFFSTVLCGLEGIGTILPIENSMRTRHHFLGCPGVLNSAMIITVSLFSTVGFFGFLKYGDSVSGSITLNLPPHLTAELVKLLVALAILFTFGLQMTAVMEVVWSIVQDKIKKESQDTGYYITRAGLVVSIVICAIALPQLAPVMSLIGAVGFSTLGLFVPAVVDLIILSEEGFSLMRISTWKNFFLIILAALALVTGSYTSILDIIEHYT